MSAALIIINPGGLTSKQCYDYVGGQPVFEDLLAHHGDILKPFRVTDRGDSIYRRVAVDAAMAVAEAEGTLISENAPARKSVVKQKQGRRFKSLT